MRLRPGIAVCLGALLGGTGAGCSSPSRPTVRSEADRPRSCAEATAAAFPGGRPGTLPAYREAERLCPSLAELASHRAFAGPILRIDCAPADVREIGKEIPQLGGQVPSAPADLVDTAVCRQYNRECADYDELRRDHATLAHNPTLANLGLYRHNQELFEACLQRYGGQASP
jgi:hypothetical protein